MSIKDDTLQPSLWNKILQSFKRATQFKFTKNNNYTDDKIETPYNMTNRIVQTKTYNFFSIYQMSIKQVGDNIIHEQNINLMPIIVTMVLYYGIKYIATKKNYPL